jgi:hypothetical protein
MPKPIAIISMPFQYSDSQNKPHLDSVKKMLESDYFVLFEFGHFEQMNIRIFTATTA